MGVQDHLSMWIKLHVLIVTLLSSSVYSMEDYKVVWMNSETEPLKQCLELKADGTFILIQESDIMQKQIHGNYSKKGKLYKLASDSYSADFMEGYCKGRYLKKINSKRGTVLFKVNLPKLMDWRIYQINDDKFAKRVEAYKISNSLISTETD